MNNIKLGIVGCGFVGGALKRWLDENNTDVDVFISDPPKGYNDDMSACDIFFISIHIPTEDNGTQDLTLLKEIISNLPNKPIFIRTTMLPHTCDNLSKEFNKSVYFMPEFLTERTAYDDFCSQPMIFTAEVPLLKRIFKNKRFIEMSSLEAELTKYTHNVFGALKVTFFNGIYDVCKKWQINYKKINEGILLSTYINHPHTQVPGPDGKFGYGGKCFPKDVNALTEQLKDFPIHNMLSTLKDLNITFRGEDK